MILSHHYLYYGYRGFEQNIKNWGWFISAFKDGDGADNNMMVTCQEPCTSTSWHFLWRHLGLKFSPPTPQNPKKRTYKISKNNIMVAHLLFAYDSVLFFDANEEHFFILKWYCINVIIGQKVNLNEVVLVWEGWRYNFSSWHLMFI